MRRLDFNDHARPLKRKVSTAWAYCYSYSTHAKRYKKEKVAWAADDSEYVDVADGKGNNGPTKREKREEERKERLQARADSSIYYGFVGDSISSFRVLVVRKVVGVWQKSARASMIQFWIEMLLVLYSMSAQNE
jgi:hypothetical protein